MIFFQLSSLHSSSGKQKIKRKRGKKYYHIAGKCLHGGHVTCFSDAMEALCMCAAAGRNVWAIASGAGHCFTAPAICVADLNLSEPCRWELQMPFIPAHQGFDSPAAVEQVNLVKLDGDLLMSCCRGEIWVPACYMEGLKNGLHMQGWLQGLFWLP